MPLYPSKMWLRGVFKTFLKYRQSSFFLCNIFIAPEQGVHHTEEPDERYFLCYVLKISLKKKNLLLKTNIFKFKL
eukprot:NP_510652.1 Uncharacterized protein CELE_F52E10.3 [Caenorhabditis elegans]